MEEEKVDHPKHYNQYPIEVIDMMVSIWGKEKAIDFCITYRCYTMWRIFSTKAQYEALKFELVQMLNRSTSTAILYSTC